MPPSRYKIFVKKTPPFVAPLRVTQLPLALKIAAKAQASRSSTRALLEDKLSKAMFRVLHGKLNLPARGMMELETHEGPKHLPFDARNTHYQGVFLTGLKLGYEAATLALLDILTGDNGVFYDVGGNFGYFSLCLSAWYLEDQEDGFFVSEPSALNLQNRMPQLALLPFERHNRFLLGDNLNILAWPREKEDTLWHLMTS